MEEQNIDKVENVDESLQNRRKFISTNLGKALFGAVAVGALADSSLGVETCHRNTQVNTSEHVNCETTYQDHLEHSNAHTNHNNTTSHKNHCDDGKHEDEPAHTDSHGDYVDHGDHNDHCNCT